MAAITHAFGMLPSVGMSGGCGSVGLLTVGEPPRGQGSNAAITGDNESIRSRRV